MRQRLVACEAVSACWGDTSLLQCSEGGEVARSIGQGAGRMRAVVLVVVVCRRGRSSLNVTTVALLFCPRFVRSVGRRFVRSLLARSVDGSIDGGIAPIVQASVRSLRP